MEEPTHPARPEPRDSFERGARPQARSARGEPRSRLRPRRTWGRAGRGAPLQRGHRAQPHPS